MKLGFSLSVLMVNIVGLFSSSVEDVGIVGPDIDCDLCHSRYRAWLWQSVQLLLTTDSSVCNILGDYSHSSHSF